VKVEKHYLDAVAQDGAGLIGYAMRLEAWGAHVTAAAVLAWEADPSVPVVQRRTLRGCLPVRDGAGLTWNCTALGVSGSWRGIGTTPAATLHAGVDWGVLAAPAQVEIRRGNRIIAGWGYAELLALRAAPWTLPLHTLLWGRFIAPGQAVTWIEWCHPQGNCWIWHGGNRMAGAAVAETGVSWQGGCLRFTGRRVLRTGRLGDTVLRAWPRLRALVPNRLSAYHETKWLTPATLELDGSPPSSGWVIHERVDFA
jgi:hypothetical protein